MKVLKKKFLNALMAVLMVFSFIFAGMGMQIAAKVTADSALENQFTNNGQFMVSQYGGNTLEYVEGIAGADGAVLQVSVNGTGSAYIVFNAPQVKASAVESIVVRIYSPEYGASDSFRASNADLSAGWLMNTAYDMSSWCEVTLPQNVITQMTDANGYLSSQVAFGVRVHGTASVYYIDSIAINLVKDWSVEFTNNGQFVVSNYAGDTVNYPYSIINGATAGLPAGYTGAVAKIGSIVNGGAAYINVDFTAAKISVEDVESVVARVYSPDYTTADQLRINGVGGLIEVADLSTWCDVALPIASISSDGYLGSFAFGLRDKGTVSDYFYIDSIIVTMLPEPEIIPVTFTNINSAWNNNTDILNNGMHYTVLHLSGLTTSGYFMNGDDWSDMTAKATINGEASYFNFCSASYIAGPNVASDYIIMYSATAPTTGDVLVIPAGTTFKVGGDDRNIYQLTNEIRFTFNGTAWVEPVSASYYVYESISPEILHTYKAVQNLDGTFTYVLPEFTAENKVLFGYVLNLTVDNELTQTFLPAGEYTTTATDCIFIALWGEFNTVDGASIRIASAETSGIRWTTTIDAEGFGNITYWAKAYTFGTELSAEGFAENFDIVANTWKVESSTYTGVLTDINSSYYEKAFTARGYVDITYATGETKRIYAQANDTTRSIKQVAELAIASGDYSGTQLSILQQIAGV